MTDCESPEDVGLMGFMALKRKLLSHDGIGEAAVNRCLSKPQLIALLEAAVAQKPSPHKSRPRPAATTSATQCRLKVKSKSRQNDSSYTSSEDDAPTLNKSHSQSATTLISKRSPDSSICASSAVLDRLATANVAIPTIFTHCTHSSHASEPAVSVLSTLAPVRPLLGKDWCHLTGLDTGFTSSRELDDALVGFLETERYEGIVLNASKLSNGSFTSCIPEISRRLPELEIVAMVIEQERVEFELSWKESGLAMRIRTCADSVSKWGTILKSVSYVACIGGDEATQAACASAPDMVFGLFPLTHTRESENKGVEKDVIVDEKIWFL